MDLLAGRPQMFLSSWIVGWSDLADAQMLAAGLGPHNAHARNVSFPPLSDIPNVCLVRVVAEVRFRARSRRPHPTHSRHSGEALACEEPPCRVRECFPQRNA